MALMSNGTDCYRLIDCMFKFQRYKTIKSRHFKEHHHHILGYRFEQEIIVLERTVQESQQRRRQFKYNKKRCNCKIKKPLSYVKNSNIVGVDSELIENTCHFRSINCSSEICASMIAGVWHGRYISPVTLKTSAERSSYPKEWPTFCPSSTVTSLPSQSESTAATMSTSYSSRFSMIYDSFDWTATETKSKFCDIPSNYLKENLNSKINLLTYKKKQSAPYQNRRNVHPESSSYYLLMMFVMIVKEIVRYASASLNRIRHKTQFLLPILILLQLLMAAPLTNCTSPPNQTIAAVASPPSSSSSSTSFVSSVASVSDVKNIPLKEAIPLASTTTPASPAISSGEEKVPEQRAHQYQISAIGAAVSHRRSGGSSITSYISHEGKIRRDPSLSFSTSGCHSCQMREQVKADNLESIKKHILLRLEMKSLPNITAPLVPHTIIENFYKNHSHFGNSKSPSAGGERSNAEGNLVYTTLSLSQSKDYIKDRANINDNNMQGDDPNIYSDDYSQDGLEDDKKDEQMYANNFDDEFFSIVNSVYVFPTMPRMRHNRKTEILNFKFKSNEHSTVSQAVLHVYIRGRDWIREYEPGLLETKNNIGDDRREIIITINRVVRRVNSTIATHTVNVTESQHKIPNGLGQWITIDVTQLVQGWLRNSTTNQGIVIKGAEGWMKPFIITGESPNSKAFTVYIEVLTKDNRKRRTKRNTSMNCSESDNEERCCRYPLEVNFIEFDWTWVVAPTSFNAYFCNGECKLGFLEKYPHTHIMQLSTAPQPCCSPTKMSPLRLLYFNTENNLVMSTIPNMAVEKCSCS